MHALEGRLEAIKMENTQVCQWRRENINDGLLSPLKPGHGLVGLALMPTKNLTILEPVPG